MPTMKRNREKEAYKKSYPSYLDPAKRLWVVEKGDWLRLDGKVYEVTQVIQPILPGSRPRIALKEVKDETLEVQQ